MFSNDENRKQKKNHPIKGKSEKKNYSKNFNVFNTKEKHAFLKLRNKQCFQLMKNKNRSNVAIKRCQCHEQYLH